MAGLPVEGVECGVLSVSTTHFLFFFLFSWFFSIPHKFNWRWCCYEALCLCSMGRQQLSYVVEKYICASILVVDVQIFFGDGG